MSEELALEYMSQDCSSLRKQLLRLKMLLQVGTSSSERAVRAPGSVKTAFCIHKPEQKPFL